MYILHVTVSNAVTPELIKRKGFPTPGVIVKQRKQFKTSKYQRSCLLIGQEFLPVAFEVQGRPGQAFLNFFNEQIARRALERYSPNPTGSLLDSSSIFGSPPVKQATDP